MGCYPQNPERNSNWLFPKLESYFPALKLQDKQTALVYFKIINCFHGKILASLLTNKLLHYFETKTRTLTFLILDMVLLINVFSGKFGVISRMVLLINGFFSGKFGVISLTKIWRSTHLQREFLLSQGEVFPSQTCKKLKTFRKQIFRPSFPPIGKIKAP